MPNRATSPASNRSADASTPALAKKYGAAVVQDSCAAALELGVADYRFVRRYLERRAPAPLSLRQVDPLIRELTHCHDVTA